MDNTNRTDTSAATINATAAAAAANDRVDIPQDMVDHLTFEDSFDENIPFWNSRRKLRERDLLFLSDDESPVVLNDERREPEKKNGITNFPSRDVDNLRNPGRRVSKKRTPTPPITPTPKKLRLDMHPQKFPPGGPEELLNLSSQLTLSSPSPTIASGPATPWSFPLPNLGTTPTDQNPTNEAEFWFDPTEGSPTSSPLPSPYLSPLHRSLIELDDSSDKMEIVSVEDTDSDGERSNRADSSTNCTLSDSEMERTMGVYRNADGGGGARSKSSIRRSEKYSASNLLAAAGQGASTQSDTESVIPSSRLKKSPRCLIFPRHSNNVSTSSALGNYGGGADPEDALLGGRNPVPVKARTKSRSSIRRSNLATAFASKPQPVPLTTHIALPILVEEDQWRTNNTNVLHDLEPVIRDTDSPDPVVRDADSPDPVVRDADSPDPVVRDADSPDPVAKLQQMQEDENYAIMLQAQFDAEDALQHHHHQNQNHQQQQHQPPQQPAARPVILHSNRPSARRLRPRNQRDDHHQRQLPVQLPLPAQVPPTQETDLNHVSVESGRSNLRPLTNNRRTAGRSSRRTLWQDELAIGGLNFNLDGVTGHVDLEATGHVAFGNTMLEMLNVLHDGQSHAPRRSNVVVRPATRGRAGGRRLWNALIDDGANFETLVDLADRLGEAGRKGLTKTEIDQLPTRKIQSRPVSTSDSATHACQICMCDYEIGEDLRSLTCFHEFHKRCIDRWLRANASCPVCRAKITLNQE